MLLVVVIILAVIAVGCGSQPKTAAQPAKSDGKNCIGCHTSREKILADLKADPLAAKEKSSETSGEG